MTEDNDKIKERVLRKISDEELEEILNEHEKWFGSDEKEGKRADLSYTDLRECILQGARLQGANLEGAYLVEARLVEARLEGAYLIRAHLQEAHLQEAHLQGARLQGANLQGANLQGADFKGAQLEGARLQGAALLRADLEGAILRGAHLRGAHLMRANLDRANLDRANLDRANLDRANLRAANFEGANLDGANLRAANFEGANVTGVKYNRRGRYQGIRVATCYGSARFKRFAQDQDFIEELRGSGRRGKIIYYIWLILSDCGRSLWNWLAWSMGLAISFGYIFFRMGPGAFVVDDLPWSLSSMIYYSVVTFTTLGFGDITPKTFAAAWWVMAEVVFGYIMLGGLISILATKLARRS